MQLNIYSILLVAAAVRDQLLMQLSSVELCKVIHYCGNIGFQPSLNRPLQDVSQKPSMCIKLLRAQFFFILHKSLKESTSLDHIKNKFGRIKNKKLIADWPDCLEGKREKGEGEASCCVHGSYCSFSCSFHLLSAAKELTSIFTETAP